jgi:MFS family permease
MCVAEVLGMLGVFAVPALLPIFVEEWSLTNTRAGWLSGVFFGGYTVAVPVLTSLTDRVDARRIYLGSAALAVIASVGFALFAEGFWTGLAFRVLGGMALAGTFMPGLRALVDRLDGLVRQRAVAFYTASFSVGTSLSFWATDVVERRWGWEWAFGVSGGGAFVAILLTLSVLSPRSQLETERPTAHLLDFRPVLRSKETMAYILAYAGHMWEMFSARAWLVTFLTFSLSLQSVATDSWTPAAVVALGSLISMWGSVLGAELAGRFGRTRVLVAIMGTSALLAFGIGFTAALPYWIVAMVSLLYLIFLQSDSAALYNGILESAPAAMRGTTLALQSVLGFGCAFLGPLVVGMILDLTGGSWIVAFTSMGLAIAAGAFAVLAAGRWSSEILADEG